MSVLLYAVTDARLDPSHGPGIAGRPLRQLGTESPYAVISDLDAELSTDHSNLWAYEHIVEQLMQRSAVLPARFGTTASTEQEILEMLGDRRDEFTAALDRVRGAVEIAVHLDAPPSVETPTTEPATSGRAYMHELLSRRQQQRAAAEQADAEIGQIARDSRDRTPTSRAYLVSRQDVAEFVARTRALELQISGPWPPYSFVTP